MPPTSSVDGADDADGLISTSDNGLNVRVRLARPAQDMEGRGGRIMAQTLGRWLDPASTRRGLLSKVRNEASR